MADKDAVRRGYDDVAETYAAERSDEGRDVDIVDRFLTPIPASARILDAGCGQGTPVLRQLGATATAVGVDFSRGQLTLATENAPGAALTQGDMTGLPFRDDAFDAVTAYHSLIHVPPEDHQTVVDEFARVLRPGGRLLVSEGPEEWSGTNSNWLESGVEMQWAIAGADATREQLRTAGFTVTEEWGAPNTLADDDARWVFFSARLDA
jgi:ubiquinone/menaquinone biosynthesis C-methylase UbiE